MSNFTCNCNRCGGSIEYDGAHAGQTTACPLCGFDTVLSVPAAKLTPRAVNAPSQDRSRSRLLASLHRHRWWIAITTIALLFATVVIIAVWKAPEAAGLLGIQGAVTVMQITGLVIAAFLFVLVIMWILFPVVVYFQLRDANRLLYRIEQNTRSVLNSPATGAKK